MNLQTIGMKEVEENHSFIRLEDEINRFRSYETWITYFNKEGVDFTSQN